MFKWLLLVVLQLRWITLSRSYSEEEAPIALPHCDDHCGKVKIPYPFGLTPNCSYRPAFEIICDNSSWNPPKPFLRKFNTLEVVSLDLYLSGELTVLSSTYNLCRANGHQKIKSIDLKGSPYWFSTSNALVVEGCSRTVMLKNRTGDIIAGCASVCSDTANEDATDCYGVGCCQASLDKADINLLEYYELYVESHDGDLDSQACNMTAALSDDSNLSAQVPDFSGLTMVLEWNTIYSVNDVKLDNVTCSYGYAQTCHCNFPYKGNPYVPHGCQVFKECRKCRHHCTARYGDDNHVEQHYCENPLLKPGPIIGFSSGVGSVLLFLFFFWLYRFIKRKREIKRKAKYFKRNGGLLLLQQQSSSIDGAFDQTKIFRINELEKATDKFNKNRILGQGGQGTVYKGMLLDGRIVAVKKSKQVDESQLEQFINEMVILSQINHRNVVKLLGCCLETEVPLIVYEFIPNGTLYQHINDPSQEFHVTWKMRLQIAAESADAIAYLHSSSSIPIYHRDIKSSNILLDAKYRAKVSDFGTSKAITIDQTHVTTCVIGTYGYLDPEYFQSNQFNEKSDVYSFGVVLVELISGKKPICPTKGGGWISLASEFLSHMETSSLEDILDERILEEGKEEEFIGIANLAKLCLDMNGKQRPTMKEIAVLLNEIRSPDCVPNSKKSDYVESKCVVSEISQPHSASFGTSSFYSCDEPGTSKSLEAEPLMFNQ